MSGVNNLLILAVAIGLAALAGGAYVSITSSAPSASQGVGVTEDAQLRILNVVAQEVDSEGAKQVRIQVATGDAPVRVNDTLIRLQTADAAANLYYSSE